MSAAVDLDSPAAISPDGKTIATVEGAVIRLWNNRGTAMRRFEGHHSTVACIAFAPDGRLVASGGGDTLGPGETLLWEPASGKIVSRLPGASAVVRFSPDGKLLFTVAPGSGAVKLWNVDRLPAVSDNTGK